ncbi:MAG: metallopeptidase TldD-related protein [Lachnospiraceae bacterium]|nr:metallopeptidase TldD-related protein [Lachnospiraceae bacterium]
MVINMRERLTTINESTEIKYQEGKKVAVSKNKKISNSFRVYKNDCVGISYQLGEVKDEDGFARAEKALERQRPYPFGLESGVRHRDKTESSISDSELVEIAEECMGYLNRTYPDYSFHGTVMWESQLSTRTNDMGMDYSNKDAAINVGFDFKHKDSKDISDGEFHFSLRKYDNKVFFKMADDYLANFRKMVDFPDEIIIDEQYYGIVGTLGNHLSGENISRKTSLLADKVGEKVFADGFTLTHDVTDKECWFNPFWDGEGVTFKDDKLVLIQNGKILTGYADKRDAARFGINHTGPAYADYTDIPGAGGLNMRIDRSDKTVKELLDGRYAVIPVMSYGGGFNEKGEYTMPVHASLLFDGEKVLGKLPPFTIISNMFDIYGKDFIGVSADQPIYNDKQLLYMVMRGEMK